MEKANNSGTYTYIYGSISIYLVCRRTLYEYFIQVIW